MINDTPPISTRTYDNSVDRFSWSAILAGVFITLGIFLSLLTLGLSLGLAVMSFENGVSLTASTWFSSIWIVLSFLVALAVATYSTARLSSRGSYISGVLNGLTVWAVTSVFIFYAVTKSSGQIIASSGQAVTEQIKDMAEPVMSNLGNGSLEDLNLEYFEEAYKDIDAPELKISIKKEIMKLKRDAKKVAKEILKNPNTTQSSLTRLKTSAKESLADIQNEYDKEKIAAIIARNSELTQPEVERAATQWEIKLKNLAQELDQFFTRVEKEAVETANAAKNSVAATSFLLFLFLCLGFFVSLYSSSKASKKTKYYKAS